MAAQQTLSSVPAHRRTDADQGADPRADQDVDRVIDRVVGQRDSLKSRHSQALARLMEEREDLRGVHALADLVDDSLRWSA